MATTIVVPDVGEVDVSACRGEVHRVTKYPMEAGKEWVVTLSGHKKGTNPRIKNDNGRLWAVSMPLGTSIPNIGDGPAIYAIPAANTSLVCQLQLYKRQVVKEARTFSLTNGADRCYLRGALEHNEFHFLFARETDGEVEWLITEEYFTISRNMSTTRSKTLERKKMEAEIAKMKACTAVDALGATNIKKEKMEYANNAPAYSSVMAQQQHHHSIEEFSPLDSFFGLPVTQNVMVAPNDNLLFKGDEPPPYSPTEAANVFSWDVSNQGSAPDVLDQVMNDVPWATGAQYTNEKARMNVMDIDDDATALQMVDIEATLSWLPDIAGL